jgi:hypothetical protein
MDRRTEDELAAVSIETKQARDIRARWNRMEPEVWTDRMLTALQHGVKGTFFAEQGLVSRYATPVSVRQSLCKVTH